MGKLGKYVKIGAFVLAFLILILLVINTIVLMKQNTLLRGGMLESASSHDTVLDNDGIFGYTAADFQQAVLGDTERLQKIEVLSVAVSDVATLSDAGFANLAIFSKVQYITFKGRAVYIVDLSGLTKRDVYADMENKTVELYIPHAQLENIDIPSDKIQFGDISRGILGFGDMNITPEQLADVQTEVKSRMEQELSESDMKAQADMFAEKTVWEIYQPVITALAPDFQLKIIFVD